MKNNSIWLKILPILFLFATFEHCYYILNLYNGGLILPVLTTMLLVLAINASIYFSMKYFEILPARIILSMSGTISVSLNVKYMLDWKPDGIFGLVIAVTVGILIPVMLSMFGWLEGEIKNSVSNGKSENALESIVKFHVEKNPELSNRALAELVGCSHTTIRKYRNGNS
ncbi:MAG: hypothetical protein KDF60_18770 [Calditrichaeota bacterium]|nr:hypothetical protein [Calditrichota bacterium]